MRVRFSRGIPEVNVTSPVSFVVSNARREGGFLKFEDKQYGYGEVAIALENFTGENKAERVSAPLRLFCSVCAMVFFAVALLMSVSSLFGGGFNFGVLFSAACSCVLMAYIAFMIKGEIERFSYGKYIDRETGVEIYPQTRAECSLMERPEKPKTNTIFVGGAKNESNAESKEAVRGA